jgi:glycolate oxidase FAD binding subunit
VFHPLAPAMLRLHQRIKAAFDPRGILNPGAMYAQI